MLVELNEITWDLIDPLIAQGKLPTFTAVRVSAYRQRGGAAGDVAVKRQR